MSIKVALVVVGGVVVGSMATVTVGGQPVAVRTTGLVSIALRDATERARDAEAIVVECEAL